MNRVGALLCLILMAGVAFAAQTTGPSAETDAITCPQLINYQGYLTDGSGTPLSGSYNLTFTMYDAATAGTAFWTEVQNGIAVASGVFNVLLGASDAIDSVPADGLCWLEVAVGNDTISPRVRMVSVPYTYKAGDAAALQGNAVSDATPSSGDVLGWSGTDWAPAAGATSQWTDAGPYIHANNNDSVMVFDAGSGYNLYSHPPIGHGMFARAESLGQGVLGQNATSNVTTAGVWGYRGGTGGFGVMGATNAADAIGVYGWNDVTGDYGIGVYGTAYTGNLRGALAVDSAWDAGVYGYAQYGGDYGVYGSGADYGVYGVSRDCGAYGFLGSDYYDSGVLGRAVNGYDYGVYGILDDTINGYGVYGSAPYNSGQYCVGVYGRAGENYGVYGYRYANVGGTGYGSAYSRRAINGYTYWGQVYAFGITGYRYNDNYDRTGGVLGGSSNTNPPTAWGCLGYRNSSSNHYGGYFTSYTTGSGFEDEGTGIGIGAAGSLMGGWLKGRYYGAHVTGDRYALYTDGNSYTNGVSAVLQETDGKREAAYVPVSENVDVYASGVAELTDGRASVSFSRSFAKLVSNQVPVVVTVTPMGPEPVYLASSDASGFSVRAVDGNGSVRFSWIAVGRRAGYEQNPELPAELASTDFDERMSEVAFNENDMVNSAQPMWFDGTTVRYDAVPQPDQGPKPPHESYGEEVEEAVEPEPAPVRRTSSISPTGE